MQAVQRAAARPAGRTILIFRPEARKHAGRDMHLYRNMEIARSEDRWRRPAAGMHAFPTGSGDSDRGTTLRISVIGGGDNPLSPERRTQFGGLGASSNRAYDRF